MRRTVHAGLQDQPLPDLSALQTLICVHDTRSVRLAARQLGVSDSAVSQSLRALEAAVGLVLFDRTQRPLQLTSHGRLLLEPAKALVNQARHLMSLAGKVQAGGMNTIRLGCVDSFAATVGPELIRGLSGRVRDLQMLSGITPHIAEQLQKRAIDFAICTDALAGDDRVRSRPLFSEAWVAVFPKSLAPARIERFRALEALAQGLPLIRYSERSVIGQQIERFLNHVGIRAPRRFEFDATDPMLSLVAGGIGWALTSPLCLLQSRHFLDKVRVLPLPRNDLGQRYFYLLSMETDWNGLDLQIAHITREAVRRTILPSLRQALPYLASEGLRIQLGREPSDLAAGG